MTDILNIALTGFLVFSGAGNVGNDFPSVFRLPEGGSKIELRLYKSSFGQLSSVHLTGYNAVKGQTNDNPHITASGAYSNPQVIIARSRDMADILPYGTIVALHSPRESRECGFSKVNRFIGYRVVADTMHKRKVRQMDVMFDIRDSILLGEKRVNPANAMGVCKADVSIVGYVSLDAIPQTQRELVWLIEGKQLSLR
jgi:3D (Asp-Asp-Asp) domain-containing protein